MYGGAQSAGSVTDLWYSRGSRTTFSNSAKAGRVLLFCMFDIRLGEPRGGGTGSGNPSQLAKGTAPLPLGRRSRARPRGGMAIIPWWPPLPHPSTWIQRLGHLTEALTRKRATSELPSSIIDGVGGETPTNSRIVDLDPPLSPARSYPPSLPFMPSPPCQQAHVVTVRRDVSQCAEVGS